MIDKHGFDFLLGTFLYNSFSGKLGCPVSVNRAVCV